MRPQIDASRRDLLRSTAASLVCAALPAAAPIVPETRERPALKLGFTSYSTRSLTLEQTIAIARRLGVSGLSIKDFHLPLDSTAEVRRKVARTLAEAGLTVLGCGVIAMHDDAAEIRSRFEYARDLGAPLIVASPEPSSLATVERMVDEFKIRVAIHNHGPGDAWYPTPEAALRLLAGRDPRLGLCIDIGHTARAGVDPAQAVRAAGARLLDVHMKDLARTEGAGEVIEVGRGVLDVPSVLRALVEIAFSGHVALEYEKDDRDPLPGMAESIGYLRGVLRML